MQSMSYKSHTKLIGKHLYSATCGTQYCHKHMQTYMNGDYICAVNVIYNLMTVMNILQNERRDI
jgi:hypothetical protein